jgi:hypothetical protein
VSVDEKVVQVVVGLATVGGGMGLWRAAAWCGMRPAANSAALVANLNDFEVCARRLVAGVRGF